MAATTDTSSAEPSALFAYATTGLSIDAQLEASSMRLAAALDEFAATCREYSLGINGSLGDRLRTYARRTSESDLWVRRVGEQFLLADQGLVMATLDTGSSVADWSGARKIEAALERAIARLPAALAEQLKALLTPENVAALVLILGVWAASHAFGIGEIMDLILAVVGVAMLGPEAIRAVQELVGFATGALGAQSDADIDRAGQHLATAIAIVGVDGAMALLAHKAGGKFGDKVPKVETTGPELVTPEGVRISVGPSGEPLEPLPNDPLAMSSRPGGSGAAPANEPVVNTDVVPLEAVQESQAALQRALDAKADLPSSAEFDRRTTASDGIKTISGAPRPLPDEFTPVSRQAVFDHADRIGYDIGADFRDGKMGGPDGAYNATHAEKQLVVKAPDDPIGITSKICSDCLEFLRYDAKFNQAPRVTTDPVYGTLVFQADGSIVRPDGSAFTVMRAGKLVEFPPLDLGSGPSGTDAGVVGP